MSAMASEITSIWIVCSTICLGTYYRKTSKLHVPDLCEEKPLVTSGFPSKRARKHRKCFEYVGCKISAILFSYPSFYDNLNENKIKFTVVKFAPCLNMLSYWGWDVHKTRFTGSDNGLSLVLCQAIIWTNAGLFLIETLWINFSKTGMKIVKQISYMKTNLKISAKWWPFARPQGVNTLRRRQKWMPFSRQ